MKPHRLKKYLKSRRITAYAIAKELGVECSYVYRVVNGQKPISEDSMLRIMVAIRVINRKRREIESAT